MCLRLQRVRASPAKPVHKLPHRSTPGSSLCVPLSLMQPVLMRLLKN